MVNPDAGPFLGLSVPFAQRAKPPSRVAEISSVSRSGQRRTVVQAIQILSGGAVVSTVWSNLMLFTSDLSAETKSRLTSGDEKLLEGPSAPCRLLANLLAAIIPRRSTTSQVLG